MDLEKAVELAKENNSEAIAYLYETTYKNAFYVALKYMQNEHDAYDVVQDSYIKAFKELGQLSSADKFTSWLSTIVAHKALDAKKKKVPTFFSETEDEESGTDISDTFESDRVDISPELAIDQKETSRLINEMISDLTDEQRFCITMFYMEDMSVKEIAQVLSVSENTVKSRLNYGRTKIKDKVIELEKKGTKLYGLLPLAFFIALFKTEAQACEVAVPSVESILSATGANASSAGITGGKTVTESAAKAGLKVFGKTVSLKVAGIVAAAVVGVGGIGVGTALFDFQNDEEQHSNTNYNEEDNNISSGNDDVQNAGASDESAETIIENEEIDYQEAYSEVLNNQRSLKGSTYDIYVTSYMDEDFGMLLYSYSGETQSGNLANIYVNDNLITCDYNSDNNSLDISSYGIKNDAVECLSEVSVDNFLPFDDQGDVCLSNIKINNRDYIAIESRVTSSTWSDGTSYDITLISYDEAGKLILSYRDGVGGSSDYDITAEMRSSFNSAFNTNYTQDDFERAFYDGEYLLKEGEVLVHITCQSDLGLLWDDTNFEPWSNKYEEYSEQLSTPGTRVYWGQGKIE